MYYGAGAPAGAGSGTSLQQSSTKPKSAVELWQKLPHFLSNNGAEIEAFIAAYFPFQKDVIYARSNHYAQVLNHFFPFLSSGLGPKPAFVALAQDFDHFTSMVALLDVLNLGASISFEPSSFPSLGHWVGYVTGAASTPGSAVAAFYQFFRLVEANFDVDQITKALHYFYAVMNVDTRIAQHILDLLETGSGKDNILTKLQPKSALLFDYHTATGMLVTAWSGGGARWSGGRYDNPDMMTVKAAINQAQRQQRDSSASSRGGSVAEVGDDLGYAASPMIHGVELTSRSPRLSPGLNDKPRLIPLLIKLSPSIYDLILRQAAASSFAGTHDFSVAIADAETDYLGGYGIKVLDAGVALLNQIISRNSEELQLLMGAIESVEDKVSLILHRVMPHIVKAYVSGPGYQDRAGFEVLNALFTLRLPEGAEDQEIAKRLLQCSSIPYELIRALFAKKFPDIDCPSVQHLQRHFVEINSLPRREEQGFMDQFFSLAGAKRRAGQYKLKRHIPRQAGEIPMTDLSHRDQELILSALFSLNPNVPPNVRQLEQWLFDGQGLRKPLWGRRVVQGALRHLNSLSRGDLEAVCEEVQEIDGYVKARSSEEMLKLIKFWLDVFALRDDRRAGLKEGLLFSGLLVGLGLMAYFCAREVIHLQRDSIDKERWRSVPLVNLIEVVGMIIGGSLIFSLLVALALKLLEYPLTRVETSRLNGASRWNDPLLQTRRSSAVLALALTGLALSNIWEWFPRHLPADLPEKTFVDAALAWYWGVNVLTALTIITACVSNFIGVRTCPPLGRRPNFWGCERQSPYPFAGDELRRRLLGPDTGARENSVEP